MSKNLLILHILVILSSCSFFELPDEHIEIEFDMKSTHNDKEPKKSE